MSIELPLSVGDTYADLLSWQWDRGAMRFDATHGEHWIRIQFHKVGGRYSRTLPDGTPNPSGRKSYWTFEVDYDRSRTKFATAREAQVAAVAEFRRRFR